MNGLYFRRRMAGLFLTSVMNLTLLGSGAVRQVDNSTLTGKMVMGYQGWFECPTDNNSGHWSHWYNGQDLSVDVLPDITEYGASGLCATTMHSADGKVLQFFSSQDPSVVEKHFEWMQAYGLDGVALQRFAGPLLNPQHKLVMDNVLANVRRAAKEHGRVFYVMYDLSGMAPVNLGEVVKDWQKLEISGLTRGPQYLHHRGHPLLGLWGLGFAHRDIKPADALALIDSLEKVSAAYGGVTMMGGVPGGWRTRTADTSDDPGWQNIWPRLGVLSPWTVGRFADDAGADAYRVRDLLPDLEEAARLRVDYLPVVFPGFSWANMMTARHQPADARRNQIPRRCGRFYWRQIFNATFVGVTMLYGAMFDEVDEGTAMFKMAPSAAQAPAGQWFLTLDADGCRLPSDWYLRLAGAATDALHKHQPVSPDLPLKLPDAH